MRRVVALAVVAGAAACSSGPPAGLGPAAPGPQMVVEVSGPGTTYYARLTPTNDPSLYLLDVSPDMAWKLLPIVFSELELPGQVLDPNSQTFGFTPKLMRRRVAGTMLEELVDCGSGIAGPNAATHLVTLSIVTRIRPEGSGSAMEMRIVGVARDRGVSSTPANCVSKGTLERLVAQRIVQIASQ